MLNSNVVGTLTRISTGIWKLSVKAVFSTMVLKRQLTKKNFNRKYKALTVLQNGRRHNVSKMYVVTKNTASKWLKN